MDLDSFLRDPRSRRRFFRTAGISLAGGSAMFLAACTDDTKNPVKIGPDESDQADVEILNGALDLELMAVAAYKAGARLLRGAVLQIGQTFLEQEQEHADGLASAIKDADGTPNRAKAALRLPAAALAGRRAALRRSTSSRPRSRRTSTRCPSSPTATCERPPRRSSRTRPSTPPSCSTRSGATPSRPRS